MLTTADICTFRDRGFLVLRSAFDGEALRREVDRALDESGATTIAAAVTRVCYVPMMCARTPASLALLDRFELLAARLLDGPVVPLRAKGMRYLGDTAWHRDSVRALSSVGFAAYLEPLDETNGALRVLPGSHREEGAAAPGDLDVGVPVATQPGDVIVFDERLLHASRGGGTRRQWRVDYFRQPQTPAEAADARAYVAAVFPADWDGGYDVDRFPSYDDDWLRSGRPAVEQLGALGAYELAREQERFTRAARDR